MPSLQGIEYSEREALSKSVSSFFIEDLDEIAVCRFVAGHKQFPQWAKMVFFSVNQALTLESNLIFENLGVSVGDMVAPLPILPL